jgi:transcriptional regulator with XRE-family HTH domain
MHNDRDKFNKALGKELKAMRKLRKISQTQLGEKLGLLQASICRIESGEQQLSHYEWVKAYTYLQAIPLWHFPIRKRK